VNEEDQPISTSAGAASSSTTAPTTAAKEKTVVYVGFWRRVAASIADTLATFAVILPILIGIYGTGYFREAQGLFAGPMDFILQYVLPAVIIIILWIRYGATPGKMLISARVVDAKTFGPISARQAVIRYLGYYVSLIPFGLGFIWVGIDRRKQGWHDKMAGTVVIEVEEKL
jgi:uncharacterized RDD family membrane protein YckC